MNSKCGPIHILTYLIIICFLSYSPDPTTYSETTNLNFHNFFVKIDQASLFICLFFFRNEKFENRYECLQIILENSGFVFRKKMSLFYFQNVRVTFYEQKARKNKKVLTWKKHDYVWLQKNAIAMLLWIQSKETSF